MFLGAHFSKSLVNRASKKKPEDMMVNTIKKNPISSQIQQQVTVQLATAKHIIDETLVPMNSAHKQNHSSTIKDLYSK
jgi:hypothetical protein